MNQLGAILFSLGIVFTLMQIALKLQVGNISGAVGPVLIVVGGLMWMV